MKIFNEEISTQLKDLLGIIPGKVNLLFFGSENNCRSCKDTEKFMIEFADLHEQLRLESYDIEKDKALAEEYSIDKVPAIAIIDESRKDLGIRFYGIPAGYEIHSLISSVKEVGGVDAELPKEIEDRITKLEKDVHIQVFVTTTCSSCPGAVITSHRLAMMNHRIKADMVEANTFPDESSKYGVRGVPKIIINEDHEFVGAHPVTKFLEVIDSL